MTSIRLHSAIQNHSKSDSCFRLRTERITRVTKQAIDRKAMSRSLCGRIFVQLAPKYVRTYTKMPFGSARARRGGNAGSGGLKPHRYAPTLSRKAKRTITRNRHG